MKYSLLTHHGNLKSNVLYDGRSKVALVALFTWSVKHLKISAVKTGKCVFKGMGSGLVELKILFLIVRGVVVQLALHIS